MAKTFVVLGMHRSATSLAAKALHEQGVFMGNEFLRPNEANPKGYYEDLEFVNLNRRILRAAQGKWWKPPKEEDIVEAGKRFRDSIKSLIESRNVYELWGWKDPRTVLTIRCYLKFLDNPHFVCCFRGIRQTAESLNRFKQSDHPDKPSFSMTMCSKLAREYNRRLLKFLSEWYAKQ